MEREFETAFITSHAQMRMKERLGIKNLDRMIRTAYLAAERGIRIDEARDSVAKKMILHYGEEARELVLYNGYYFVFTDNFDTLVTVFAAEKKVSKWIEANKSKENGYRKYNYSKDIRSAVEEELSFA